MPSIARKNLFEDIPRFLVAQAGIMFAVSLITIQKGILDGFTRSTTLLIEQSTADLWVANKAMEYLELTTSLTVEELRQARQVSGVEQAEAITIQGIRWRGPTGRIDSVRIYGFNPDGNLFANWKLDQGKLSNLKAPYTIMADKANIDELGLKQIGDTGSISSLPAKFVGATQDTQSMASSAYLFASLETANAYLFGGLSPQVNCKIQTGNLECTNVFESAPQPSSPKASPPPPRRLNLSDPISYVLVKAAPGQDIQALRQRLEAKIPNTLAYTKEEIAQRTSAYWRERTGVGFILGLGAAVGFVVGMVVVSQILYSSVSDHLKEFGTLKAMGASDWVIYRVITEQALWMSVLGYLPSMLLCMGLGTWTVAIKGIMILITPATALGVFGITVVMCVSS
ncbi:MAG: ABC transporter permease, partial [Kovacikia sp.]